MMNDAISVRDSNKSIVLRFVDELINKGDPDIADELVSAGFIDHDAPADQVPGPAGVKATFARVRDVFADLRTSTEDVIAEGDRVAVRHRSRAIHIGRFLGFDGTRKPLHWTTISIYRLRDGRIVERWGFMDIRALQEQLAANQNG